MTNKLSSNAQQIIHDALSDGGESEVMLIIMESIDDALKCIHRDLSNPQNDDHEFWQTQLTKSHQHGQEALVAASRNDFEKCRLNVLIAEKEEAKLGEGFSWHQTMELINAFNDMRSHK